jgi:photosystem II stability/assembly factor-like uncharacterized protein
VTGGVSDNPAIAYSTAASPTAMTVLQLQTGLTANNTLKCVTSSPSTAVAVGFAGRIFSSTDGTSWTSRTSGVTQPLNAVSYAGGVFIAVGNAGILLTSPDGITWTNRTANTGTTNNLVGINYINSNWVANDFNGNVYTVS